jgi:hypothetical protein
MQACGGPTAEMPGPFVLHGDFGPAGHFLRCESTVGEDHQPGARIDRVRDSTHVSGALELIDHEGDGLLGDPRLLGEVGDPGALGADPGQDARLGNGDVVEPGPRRGRRGPGPPWRAGR